MKKNKIFEYVITMLFVIFAIILIIQLIMKLTGHSPIEAQIFYVFIVGIISYLLITSFRMGAFVGEVREFMNITKNSFAKLRDDMNIVKRDLVKVKDDIMQMRIDVRYMKKSERKDL